MTSIEWLISKLGISETTHKKLFEQAKEMHKQEIIDAYNDGEDGCPEQYYAETFVSKGHQSVISENGNELLFDKEGNLIKELPKQETLYTEEQVSRAIALYLEGHSFSEIIQLFKKPKKD